MRSLTEAAHELAAQQAGRAAVVDVDVSRCEDGSVMVLLELENGELLVSDFECSQRFDVVEVMHAVAAAMADRARLN